MAPLVPIKFQVFLLTSLYFQFSWVQVSALSPRVRSRLSDQWRVPGPGPGHVTRPAPSPGPNQAAHNFPFPGLFPSILSVSLPLGLSESLCSGFSSSDDISPGPFLKCLPSPLLPFKFELVETKLKSPVPLLPFSKLLCPLGCEKWGLWQNCSGQGKLEKVATLPIHLKWGYQGIVVWSPEETEYYAGLPGEMVYYICTTRHRTRDSHSWLQFSSCLIPNE